MFAKLGRKAPKYYIEPYQQTTGATLQRHPGPPTKKGTTFEMDNVNNTPDPTEGQEPKVQDSDPPNFSPLLPNLSSLTPGDESIGNAQILLLGSLAINTILTGSPAPESYRVPELITAANWLWRWHMATAGATSKEEFIEVMTYLLKD